MSRMQIRPVLAAAATMLMVTSWLFPVEGQLGRLRRTAERAVEREVERQVDRAVTGMVRCAFDDPACIEKAKEDGEPVELVDEDGEVITDANGNPVSDPEYAAAARQKPGDGAWSNYDFVPGERTLFHEDYADDRGGDFPRRFEFLTGNMEVVESDEQRMLRATSGSAFAVPLPEELPERFTLEFPVHWAHTNLWMRVLFEDEEGGQVAPRRMGWYQSPHLLVDYRSTGIKDIQEDGPESVTRVEEINEGWVTVRLMADGDHVKVFVNEKRTANIPQAALGRASKVWFVLADGSDETPIYVGPITVAAGGRDLYDRLEAEGSVTTRGILFNSDSDEIRPESTPTLEEIGRMLNEHPDLRLGVAGHTDSQGDDDYNLNLSRRRAAAVRRYLVETFGIDDERLEASGQGEAAPVDTNDTAEGRANNRRVELTDLREGAGAPAGGSSSDAAVGAADAPPTGTSPAARAATQTAANPPQPEPAREISQQPQASVAGVGPIIGYVEIEGRGRFDVHASPEGQTGSQVVGASVLGDFVPTAAWLEGQDRFIIFALPTPGASDQGWVDIDIAFYEGRTELHNQVHRIFYYEPSSARHPPRQHLFEGITIEELSEASDGTWTVRMSFDGTAQLYEGGEAPMKGVIRVEGMPVRNVLP